MKQFTGKLELVSMKDKDCYQTVPVLVINIRNLEWWVGTISHRSVKGHWAVDILGGEHLLATEEYTLNRLMVNSGEGSFVVAWKQWNKIVGLVGKDVVFSKKPLPFKLGSYAHECLNCGSDFTAGKEQPNCESCCELLSTASVITPSQKAKPRLPVQFTNQQLSALGEFLQGKALSVEDFKTWLINKYGSNSIKR